MKVRILESARHDLRTGFRFYEQQEAGVGEAFLNSLFADIDSLAVYGGIHPLKFGLHWLLASRFPYAIYYRIDSQSQEIVVRAILDCRRDPARIKNRLKRERSRGSIE